MLRVCQPAEGLSGPQGQRGLCGLSQCGTRSSGALGGTGDGFVCGLCGVVNPALCDPL